MQRDYSVVARALARSPDQGDKKLALSIMDFVRRMSPLTTQHQQRIAELKNQMEKKGKTAYISSEIQR